nr:CPBP family intramembrane glutamic endopeptidase [Lysinibacillus timonensis]
MSFTLEKKKNFSLLISPIIIIILGYSIANLFSRWMAEWAWVPLAIVYWSTMGFCIFYFKENKKLIDWFITTKITRLPNIISIILSLFPLSILILNFNLLNSPLLIILWICFALINPWFEELYWRGLLLDASRGILPTWISIIYSTFFYCISHPFMWGVFSIANTSYHLYIYLILMGIVWAITYHKTNSLKWVVVSHFIVDIGNLAVFTFLNIYIPPGL